MLMGFFFFLPLALIFFLLISFIPVLYEATMVSTRGAILGKIVMNIRVVNIYTGGIPEWKDAFLRGIVMFIPGFVRYVGWLLFLIIDLSLLQGPSRQDMAAKTSVGKG